jgi:hypothetical protein
MNVSIREFIDRGCDIEEVQATMGLYFAALFCVCRGIPAHSVQSSKRQRQQQLVLKM